MSVSDPLLRELKGYAVRLVQSSVSSDITDDNADLQAFCQNLEKVFQKGLLRNSYLGFAKVTESWHWLELLAEENNSLGYSYISAINSVKSSSKVVTPSGKLRLLIRTCLVKKCLHVPVEILVRQRYPTSFYDETHSILGDEILGEIFLSVLLQCSRLQFKLDLSNTSFLDDSWMLPYCIKLEFVPCKVLGICVCFASGKAVIVGIKSNSVAAEDDKIEVGDILDELNGGQITTSKRGRLSYMMKKASGQPVVVNIIKAHYPGTGDIYPPIIGLLRQARLDPDELRSHYNGKIMQPSLDVSERRKKVAPSIRPGFDVIYVGNISTGKHGDVRQIDQAMNIILFNSQIKTHLPSLFEIQEIGVKVTEKSTGKVTFKHSYMEISSCGRTLSLPNYFAYIAGDVSCNIAKEFKCYVFQSNNEEHIHTILQSIGQGFQRTHFAV